MVQIVDKSTVSIVFTLLVVGSAIGACAVGSGLDDGDAGAPHDPSPTSATNDAAHVVIDSRPPAMPEGPGDAGRADARADATADGGVDSDAATNGNAASCATPNTCATALDVGGAISGDTNADTQTATGITAKWLSVRVGENDNSISGAKLRMQATLVSPPGVNFDLYVYMSSASDVRECTTTSGASTSASTNDTTTIEWGEGTIANGSDDGRTVSIEVRYVSGTCDPSTKWTLALRGNP